MYQKGQRVERKVRKRLEEMDYYVIKSAASKGIFDLIAFNASGGGIVPWLCIQVKANSKPSKKEMQKIENVDVPEDAEKQVWVWRDRAKEPVIITVK